jgi:hypothetical protein
MLSSEPSYLVVRYCYEVASVPSFVWPDLQEWPGTIKNALRPSAKMPDCPYLAIVIDPRGADSRAKVVAVGRPLLSPEQFLPMFCRADRL